VRVRTGRGAFLKTVSTSSSSSAKVPFLATLTL
jgi:hypothetical protein